MLEDTNSLDGAHINSKNDQLTDKGVKGTSVKQLKNLFDDYVRD